MKGQPLTEFALRRRRPAVVRDPQRRPPLNGRRSQCIFFSTHLRDFWSDKLPETEGGEFENEHPSWQCYMFIRNYTLNGVTNIWRLWIYNSDDWSTLGTPAAFWVIFPSSAAGGKLQRQRSSEGKHPTIFKMRSEKCNLACLSSKRQLLMCKLHKREVMLDLCHKSTGYRVFCKTVGYFHCQSIKMYLKISNYLSTTIFAFINTTFYVLRQGALGDSPTPDVALC